MSQSESLAVVPMPVQLAPGNRGLVRAVAPVADVVAAQAEYHQLCGALLDRGDYQRIGSKDFPKKSAWRKLAVAFNVSVELIDRTYERDEAGRIVRAEVIARATAPNGRTMDGLGACDLFEKCCPGGAEGCPIKAQRHRHCRTNCPGSVHFSNASHDLPATAATRATNRACADLFGMGEVSAEEVANEHAQYTEAPARELTPDEWLVEVGQWATAEDHASHRKATDELAKSLSDDAKAAVKEWIDSNTSGFRSLWTRPQAEAYRVLVEMMVRDAQKASPGHESIPAGQRRRAAQEAQDAPSGPAQPETLSEAPAPAPAPPSGESLLAGSTDLPEYAQVIVAEVKAMGLGDVQAALKAAGLDDKGGSSAIRHRLAEHRVANAPEAGEPF